MAQRFEYRVVCLLASETLDTLPPDDQRIGLERRSLLEHIHEFRFANAGFPRYEDHLALARQYTLDVGIQPGERSLTANDFCIRPGFGCWPHGCARIRDRRYELIAPFAKRFNKHRLIGAVAQDRKSVV